MNTATLQKPGTIVFTDRPPEQPEPEFPFPALTLEERMRFELFGYTIVEGLFTEQELQSIEAAANRAKEEILATVGARTFKPPPPPKNTMISKRAQSGGGSGQRRLRVNFISTVC